MIFEAFALEPNDGILALNTRPAGATVSVNGEFAGSSPVSLPLVSGKTHRLQLSKPGYLPVEKSVVVEPDEEQQLLVELPGEFGIVFASFQIVAALTSKYAHILEERIGQRYSLIMLVVLLVMSYVLMSNFIFLFSFSFAFLQIGRAHV